MVRNGQLMCFRCRPIMTESPHLCVFSFETHTIQTIRSFPPKEGSSRSVPKPRTPCRTALQLVANLTPVSDVRWSMPPKQ
jgi:hypothetical protein